MLTPRWLIRSSRSATVGVVAPGPAFVSLDAEIAVLQRTILAKSIRSAIVNNASLFDEVVAVCDLHERLDVLVDDEDRLACRFDLGDAAPDFGADHRRQT